MIRVLRDLLGTERAASFQLMGEDLAIVPPARLRSVVESYEAALAGVPPSLRGRFEAEQAAILGESHAWLRRYNHSVHGRLAGYLALAERCSYEYPWPVVAMLGICQVMTGMAENHLYGVAAGAARRVGHVLLGDLVDRTEDILRRTNRGIFADSVPTVLFGIRVHELRAQGDAEVAGALLDGPAPLLMDDESLVLARGVADGLGILDPARRFRTLARLTRTHFAREQAIFSHHMGSRGRSPRRLHPLVARLVALRSVPAPVVLRDLFGRRRIVFRKYTLPGGFDIRDHDARVREFERAFVASVTDDIEDYRTAERYVRARFGRTPR